MNFQKTTNVALISSLLLAGCSSSAPESPSSLDEPVLSAHEILEKADRNDLRLDSYRMHSLDSYKAGSALEKTEFDVRVQFDGGVLYMISSFPEGSSRLARYQLKKNRNHTIDGSSFAVTSGIWAFLDADGLLNDCFSVTDEMEVEDYISIPEAYLYSQNTYRLSEKDGGQTVIELVNPAGADQNRPEGAEASVQFILNPEGYMTEMSARESGPDESYVFERTRRFAGFNLDLINTKALETFLGSAANGEIPSGQKVEFSEFDGKDSAGGAA